jgi:predicted DNA-binding WGR domain protein
VAAVGTDPKETHGASPGASPDPSGMAFRHLRWENHSRRRYYEAVVQQDLFGGWEVWRAWGGIGSARGGQLVVPSASAQAGLAELDALARRRQRRGYAMARGPQTGAAGPSEGR